MSNSEIDAPSPESDLTGETLGSLFGSEALKVSATKLSALESLFTLMVRDCSYSVFIKEILNILIKSVKSEAGSILEVDHANKVLFFRAAIGTSTEGLKDIKIPIGQGISGHVAESCRPISVSNVSDNSIHLKSISKIVGFEPKNLVAIPIIIRGKIFAVLELLNRIGEPDFTPADVELLTYLAYMSSRLIEVRMMIAWAVKKGGPNGS